MVINENITSTSINTTLLNAFKAFDHYCKARLRLSMVVGSLLINGQIIPNINFHYSIMRSLYKHSLRFILI